MTGQRRKINYTPDGKISKALRRGKHRYDSYRIRSQKLVQKAGELQSITGCAVKVSIVPAWDKGKFWSYESENFSHLAPQEEQGNSSTQNLLDQKIHRYENVETSEVEFCVDNATDNMLQLEPSAQSQIKIGIIGGTGLNNPELFENPVEKKVYTIYGEPSDVLLCGKIAGVDCVLLARHSRQHSLPPSYINYRGNICALKDEGCTHILSTTACGSLQEYIKPGEFVILDQFIDRTTKRDTSFYDGKPGSWSGICHIPMAHPFCPLMGKILQEACANLKIPVHNRGTVVTIEGPRFSTKAESELFRTWRADVINMTSVPEVTLAKEAGILYASVAMATDYDCWREDHTSVSVQDVFKTFKANSANAVKVIIEAVKLIGECDWESEITAAKELVKQSTF